MSPQSNSNFSTWPCTTYRPQHWYPVFSCPENRFPHNCGQGTLPPPLNSLPTIDKKIPRDSTVTVTLWLLAFKLSSRLGRCSLSRTPTCWGTNGIRLRVTISSTIIAQTMRISCLIGFLGVFSRHCISFKILRTIFVGLIFIQTLSVTVSSLLSRWLTGHWLRAFLTPFFTHPWPLRPLAWFLSSRLSFLYFLPIFCFSWRPWDANLILLRSLWRWVWHQSPHWVCCIFPHWDGTIGHREK